MTAAMRTMIDVWAIPHMGARRLSVGAMSNNIASQKVFIKNGFEFVEELKDVWDLAKLGRGEGLVSVKHFVRNVKI